jgi:hypothetical protein
MRKKFFTLKLRGRIHVPKSSRKNNEQEGDSEIHDSKKCVCTSYKKTDETDAPEASSMGATGSLTWENRAYAVHQYPLLDTIHQNLFVETKAKDRCDPIQNLDEIVLDLENLLHDFPTSMIL